MASGWHQLALHFFCDQLKTGKQIMTQFDQELKTNQL